MRRDQFHDPPEPGMNVGGARFAVRRQGDRRRARCRHRVGYCAIVSCWLDEVFWCRWVDKPLLSGRAPAPNQGPATRRGRFRQCGGPMTADILISLFENALPRIFCICSGPLPLPATHESMLIWVAGRGEGRCREFSNRCQDSTLAPRQEIYLINESMLIWVAGMGGREGRGPVPRVFKQVPRFHPRAATRNLPDRGPRAKSWPRIKPGGGKIRTKAARRAACALYRANISGDVVTKITGNYPRPLGRTWEAPFARPQGPDCR